MTLDLSKGLIGHWTMDERDIDSGMMRDRSGYDHHGSMDSGITTGHDAPVGTACGWDGSHKGVSVPHSDELNTFTEGITVACWVYSQQHILGDYSYIIHKGTFSNSPFFCVLEKNGSFGVWRIGSADGYASIQVPLTREAWTHGAMTWDQETGEWRAYSDGELANTKTFEAAELFPNTNNVHIGQDNNNLIGRLSDLRLYDRALSPEEINALSNMRASRQQTTDLSRGLVGHWTCNEELFDGTRAMDSSAHDNHAVVQDSAFDAGMDSPVGTGFDFSGGNGWLLSPGAPIDGATELTVCGWFSAAGSRAFAQDNSFQLFPSGDTEVGGHLYTNESRWLRIDNDHPNASPSGWRFCAMVYSDATGELTTYLDLDVETSFIGETLDLHTDVCGIGNRYSGDFYFDAGVSDLRIYDRALSEEEIRALYHRRSAGQETPTPNLSRGLIGHWSMDNADTEGDVIRDRSAYDNHGTIGATISTGYEGRVGEAYRFGPDGDDIKISHTDGLSHTGDISYSFWINHTGLNGNWAHISNFGGSNNGSVIIEGNEEIQFSVEKNGTRENIREGTITEGQWEHVVCTHDTSTGEMAVYRNAEEVGQGTVPTGPRDERPDLRIGDRRDGRWDTLISDFRVYNRVLSPEEIHQLAHTRQPAGSGGGLPTTDSLTVAAGETRTVGSGLRVSYADAQIDGTLEADGTLETEERPASGDRRPASGDQRRLATTGPLADTDADADADFSPQLWYD